MGLIGNLKDAVKKTIDEKAGKPTPTRGHPTPMRGHPSPVLLGSWTSKPQTSTVQLDPKERKKMYVYYPEALSDLPEQAAFVLEAMPFDAVLYSYIDDMPTDTIESDGVVFARNGRIVGASFCFRDVIKQHVKRGRRVLVQAEKVGMYNRDIPDVYIYGTWDPDGFRELKL